VIALPTLTGQQLLHRFLLTVALTLITLMLTIDSTIANVALPHMRGSLGASQDQIAWVLTSYILATAIFLPPSAFLANKFGRKRLLVICVIGFLVTSVMCGLATSIEQMVVFRFLQGAFGAPTTPLVQAALLDLYSAEERGKSMSIFSFGVMMGSIFGPTLGGALTEFYNWRWVFFVNLPVGLLALIGVVTLKRETPRNHGLNFDSFGFIMLAVSIAALQLGLDRGESQNWFQSPEIIIEFAIAALCFYTFVAHMFTFREPFVEVSIFRDRNFLGGIIFLFFASGSMMVVMALIPVYLQNLLGLPVLDAGLLMAPRSIATLITLLLIPRLAKRFDLRLLIVVGVLLSVISLHQMAHFTLEISHAAIISSGLLQGVGLALTTTPASILVVSTLERRYYTEASVMQNLMRSLGGSIWISLMVAMFSHNTQIFHAELTQSVTAFRDATQTTSIPQAWDWQTPFGVAALEGEIGRQASGIAIFGDFSIMQWMTLLTLPLVLLFSRINPMAAKRRPEDEVIHVD
jgi:DHA2 family multidrug resistance protein